MKRLMVYLAVSFVCFATFGYSAETPSPSPTVIESYTVFLGTLDKNERSSSLVARDEFVKRFKGAPNKTAREGFEVFRSFYSSVVSACYRKYFFFGGVNNPPRQDYRRDYQDALNDIMSIERTGTRVTHSLLNDDPIEVLQTRSAEFRAELKKKYGAAIDELIDYRKCGIGFLWGEGDWYTEEDAQFLADAASIVGGDLAAFWAFNAEEAKERIGHDATLLISWDQLRQTIIRYERFSKAHPDLPETKSEIEPTLRRLTNVYANGTDNTHAFDHITGKIDPALRASYETFLRENKDSSYYTIFLNMYTILQRNNFTKTPTN